MHTLNTYEQGKKTGKGKGLIKLAALKASGVINTWYDEDHPQYRATAVPMANSIPQANLSRRWQEEAEQVSSAPHAHTTQPFKMYELILYVILLLVRASVTAVLPPYKLYSIDTTVSWTLGCLDTTTGVASPSPHMQVFVRLNTFCTGLSLHGPSSGYMPRNSAAPCNTTYQFVPPLTVQREECFDTIVCQHEFRCRDVSVV